MRIYEFYYSGPSDQDPLLPDAPTAKQMCDDFKEVLKVSGYVLQNTNISYNKNNFVVEISGKKYD